MRFGSAIPPSELGTRPGTGHFRHPRQSGFSISDGQF